MATPRRAGGRLVTSRPPISTRPALAVSRPAMMRRQVVLPHPDGPSNTVKLPALTSSDTPSSAVTPPHRRLTSVNRTAVPPDTAGEPTSDEPLTVIVRSDNDQTAPCRAGELTSNPSP